MRNYLNRVCESLFSDGFKKEMVRDLEVLVAATLAIIALVLFMNLSGFAEANLSKGAKTKMEAK